MFWLHFSSQYVETIVPMLDRELVFSFISINLSHSAIDKYINHEMG